MADFIERLELSIPLYENKTGFKFITLIDNLIASCNDSNYTNIDVNFNIARKTCNKIALEQKIIVSLQSIIDTYNDNKNEEQYIKCVSSIENGWKQLKKIITAIKLRYDALEHLDLINFDCLSENDKITINEHFAVILPTQCLVEHELMLWNNFRDKYRKIVSNTFQKIVLN